MQAVLHTVNIRFPPEQIAYTISHAEDEAVLVRDEFLPLFSKAWAGLKSVKHVVVMNDSGILPESAPKGAIFLEDLIKNSDKVFVLPNLTKIHLPHYSTLQELRAPQRECGSLTDSWCCTPFPRRPRLAPPQSPVRLESRDTPYCPSSHVSRARLGLSLHQRIC